MFSVICMYVYLPKNFVVTCILFLFFCLQHFALQLPFFSQRFQRQGYPSQAHSSNQFSFLAFHQREKKVSIFATHVLHDWIVVFRRFWIDCVFYCLREPAKSKQAHKTPITVSTSCNISSTVFGSKIYDAFAIVIRKAAKLAYIVPHYSKSDILKSGGDALRRSWKPFLPQDII